MNKTVKSRMRTDEQIKKDNEKFAKMTKMEKRVAIAKDVLQLVRKQAVQFNRGVAYFQAMTEDEAEATGGDTSDIIFRLPKEKPGMVQLQQVLPKLTMEHCTVCGIGAAFLSSVRLGDKFKLCTEEDGTLMLSDVSADASDVKRHLSRFFSHQELDDIESFFEGDSSDVEGDQAVKIVFKSILKNNGKFDLDDVRKRLEKQVAKKYPKEQREGA